MNDMAEQTISHYKILEKIGAGGMGVVYKARDNRLKRTVALKFLHPHKIDDQEKRARFFLEAQAAAALNHPNICTIYEIDETTTDDRQTFIAMEYVAGQNLQQKIETGSFKLEQTLELAIQIAEGLCEAHSKGVIHRDIKSANIMVTDKGQVKIMDFGLAKLTTGVKITRDGKTLGTMAYISPEQARGGEIDHRTDIWSLGVILYEMITGQLPFEGESEVAMIVSVLNNEPKPFALKNNNVPAELERIIFNCLEKNVEYRYQTADQVLTELKNLKLAFDSETNAVPQIVHRPKGIEVSKKTIRFALIALAIITALLTSIYYALFYEKIKEPRVVNVRPLTRTTAIFEAGAEISPNGNCVTYNSNESGNSDVWLQPISLGEKKNLTSDYKGEDVWATWSSDGNWIFFNSTRDGGGLYKVSPYGGTPVRIVAFSPDDKRRGFTVSPDGLSLAYTESETLYTMKISEGIPKQIPLPHKCGYPTWTPDGTRVLYFSGSMGNIEIWTVSVTGSLDPMLVYANAGRCEYPTISRDGKSLFFKSTRHGNREVWWVPLNKKGKAINPGKVLMPGVDCYTFSISADGSKLAYLDGDYNINIYSIPLNANRVLTIKDATQITEESQNMGQITLSPNYEWIAFNSAFQGPSDIWFVDRNGKGLRQFTADTCTERGLSWSPDSSLLAFHRNLNGNVDIWAFPVIGGPAKRLTTHPAVDENACWSPDGKEIVFSSDRSGELELWILTIVSGELRLLTKNIGSCHFPNWSPDGLTIAFFADQEEEGKICLVPAKGGEARLMTKLGNTGYTEPIWSPDGKRIFYSYDPGGEDAGPKIYAVSVAYGSNRIIFDNKDSGEPGTPKPWLATDGERLFFVVRKFSSDIKLADLVYE